MPYPTGAIPVTNNIGTTDVTDTFPTHLDSLGKGGHRTIDTAANRDLISTDRRSFGMLVTVNADGTAANNTTWMLANVALGGTNNTITDNSNWIVFKGKILQNIVIVDLVNGNNTTAVKYDITRPYATVTAAETAAVSGDLIYVLPGTDTVGNYSKNGVNYYFCDGYIYTGSADWFGDAVTTTPVVCKIGGYARGVNCGRILFSQNIGAADSSYVFGIRSWLTTATTGLATFNGANVRCTAIEDISAINAAAAGRIGRFQNQNNPGATVCNVYIKCATARSRNMILAASSGTCTFNIKCYFDVDLNSNYGTAAATSSFEIQSNGNIINLYHEGNIVSAGTISAGENSMFIARDAGSTIESYSNIVRTGSVEDIFGYSTPGVAFATTQAGTVRHYGNISTEGPILFVRGTGTAKWEFNGNYTGCSGAYAFPVIDAQLEVSGSITMNGLLKNSNNNANAHGIQKIDVGDFVVKVLQGTRIVVTNAGAYCLTSNGTPPTFKVYPGSCSNVVIDPTGGAVTQQISIILTDTNVS